MSKYEYLAQLEKLLAALPAEERQDAMRYYEEYFDAAGEDKAEQTAAELGDPATVAHKILEDFPAAASETAAAPEAAATSAGGIKLWQVIAVIAAAVLILCGVMVVLFGSRQATPTDVKSTVLVDSAGAPQNSLPAAESQQNAQPDAASQQLSPPAAANTQPAAQAGSQSGGIGQSYAVRSLDVEMTLGSIEILQDANATGITVSADNPAAATYSEIEKDGELKINCTMPYTEGMDAGLGSKLIITVPAQMRDMELDLYAGEISFETLCADKVELKTKAGAIAGALLMVQQVELDTVLGSVAIDLVTGVRSGSNANNIDVKSDVGSIELTLSGTAADYELEYETAVGALEYGDEQIAGVSGGKVERNLGAACKLEIETNVAQTTINFAG